MAVAEPFALRLALTFAGDAARPILEALYAIDAEIAAASRPGLEHPVAHAKLAWWRGEADRLAAGRPEHPFARTLLRLAGSAPRYERLHERLAAADLALVGFAPATEAELLALLERSHGALQSLAAEALASASDPALEAFGRALGRGLGLVEALADPTAVPLGELPRETVATRARESLDEAPAHLPAGARAQQAHGLVHAALARARLERLERTNAGAPPSPFLQLWLAWRAARRARRE